MNNSKARAALKSAIITTTTQIRQHRIAAASSFIMAREQRRVGDKAAAEASAAEGHVAHADVMALRDGARAQLLAYAFLRGRPYAQLERNRKRAKAPSVHDIADALLSVGEDVANKRIAAWIERVEVVEAPSEAEAVQACAAE